MEEAAELAGTARSSHRRAKLWGLDFPSGQTRQIPTGFTVSRRLCLEKEFLSLNILYLWFWELQSS